MEDFQYLTYYASIFTGKADLFIYNCDTYPLCQTNLKSDDQLIPIQNNQDTFSFTYIKNELSDISPISKKQKIIMFKCNEVAEYNECRVKINIFQNNNNILMMPYINHYYYAKENNENEYSIISDVSIRNTKQVYATIETLSGKISISFGDTKYNMYKNNNKKTYIFNDNKKDYISFKIKAIKSSFYRVNYYYKIEIRDYGEYISFSNGANYLFKFEKDSNLDIYPMKFIEFYSGYDEEYLNYISFYPINCKIQIENVIINEESNEKHFYQLEEKNNFYQDIWHNNEEYSWENDLKNMGYKVKNIDSKNDCMFNVSIFRLINDTIDKDNNGLFLENHIPQKFVFNQEVKSLKFSYPHIVKDKDIEIKIKLYDKEKYQMKIYFDNVQSNNIYEINSNSNYIIEAKEWKDICIYDQQICKISFRLTSKNIIQESFVEIEVNSDDDNKYENEEEEEEKDNDKGKSKILFIIIPIIIIAIIIPVVIIFIILKKKKKTDFKKDIEEIPENKGLTLI